MIEQLKIFWAEKKYRILFCAILIAALGVRLLMFLGPMEYDEIWSLGYVDKSVGAILTDLATPNNHPLNSLFMKVWLSCPEIAELPQLTRLHSLIFGMLSVTLTGMLALGIFRSRAAALFSMLFLAFDAAAVFYSDQARGYSTQLFFLLCFANGLVWSGKLRKFLPWKYLPEAAIVVGALGAVLSVPSAPIFLAAMLIAGRLYRRKTPEASLLIAIGVAWALVAVYLGINQAALREAQTKFGTRFTDFSQWMGFLFMILQDFFALGVVPFLLVLLATDRRRGMLLGFCALAIVGSAAFVSAGPSRVYLPLCVLVALGCGRGAHALLTVALCGNNRKLAKIIAVAAVFLAVFGCYQLYDTWHITDYYGWLNAGQSMPPEYLNVYPATSSYPLWWNSDRKKLEQDQVTRAIFDNGGTRRLLCFGIEPGHINGANPKAKDGSMPQEDRELSVKGTPKLLSGFKAVEYKLYPAAEARPGEGFIVVLPLGDGARATVKALHDSGCDLLILNPHFPVVTIYGKAPAAVPGTWQVVRNSGARIYTFAPPAPAAKPQPDAKP